MRHTWAPIIMGISPPAYTDEDLDMFERYSTEQVEIDGTTKTRYEWSQAMRRMETAIRQKKDTAILAEAAGDQVLRRDCQSSINTMVKEYERISDRTGLGPDFRRTYVAGFKDVDSGKELQEAASRAIMNVATGGHRNEKPLTPEQISDAVEYAVSLGMPRENIRYSDNGETSYISFQGMIDILRIGTDVLPNPQGKTSNELITCHGAIAHEVVGHRATCLRHTNGEARSVYDEVQASVRAAKFAKGLTDYERELLMNDARDRVASIGADFDEYIKSMDVWER